MNAQQILEAIARRTQILADFNVRTLRELYSSQLNILPESVDRSYSRGYLIGRIIVAEFTDIVK